MSQANNNLESALSEKGAKVLILGTGIAGLCAALKLADHVPVLLVSKLEPQEGATRYAQGGIASVWSKTDTIEDHKNDTLLAGAGLCNEEIVDLCVREGPHRVEELIQWGVPFARRSDGIEAVEDPAEVFDLHREAGHGKRRILHAQDTTGLAIQTALLKQAFEHPRIQILSHHMAVNLVTEGKVYRKWGHVTEPFRQGQIGRCLGAYLLNIKNGSIHAVAAAATILATGGAGKVYLYTSNPDVATGDGIALAYREGARVSNMEFMQFHPTCLYHPLAKSFLISEALRGEGALLKNLQGSEFVSRYHPKGSLAPRDIVARAIDFELKRTGDEHVLLDATHIPAAQLIEKFPNIYRTCLKYGIDMTTQPIPVVPAAHYMCGGVTVDAWGQTSVEGLYAIGEVACTGLHGANRLASNSLLEGVVFAHRTAEHIWTHWEEFQRNLRVIDSKGLPAWETGQAVAVDEQIDIAALWQEIRTLMWNYVGIARSNRRLEMAKRRLELFEEEVNRYYWNFLLTQDLVELRNILTVAQLIVQSAMYRKESRGLHYTVDYPEKNDRFYQMDTVL